MAQSKYVASYDAQREQPYQIRLSDVRTRPCMWTGTTDAQGLHCLLENVLALGLSESHEDRCIQITVTLAADHSVTVEHDGYGLASLGDEKLGLVVLERALTEVEIIKGLFRVGAHESCLYAVNALSTRLSVDVHFGRTIYRKSYTMGVPDGPAYDLGPTTSRGLRLTFLPDPTIFEGELHYETLETRLRELAFLHPGLHITLTDERPGQLRQQHFQFNDGLVAFARFLHPPSLWDLTDPIEVTGVYETGAISAVLWFSLGSRDTCALYANDHATPQGGTGLEGLLSGTARVLNRIGRAERVILDTEDDLGRHDAAHGLNVILSVHLDAIKYSGNTGSRVGNPELRPQVEWMVERQLGAYFAANRDQAYKVVQHCLEHRRHKEATQTAP